MTLIEVLANSAATVLVADQRLTRNGRLVTDQSNKAITVMCRDARFAVSFAGLAELGSFGPDDHSGPAPSGRFRTAVWLVETMTKVAEPDHFVFPMIDRFVAAATTRWRTLPAQGSARATEFVFAGHARAPVFGTASFVRVVSNFVDEGRDSTEDFRITEASSGLRYVMLAGRESAVNEDDLAVLQSAVESEQQSRTLELKAVEVLRRTARRASSQKVISEDCTSIVLPRNPALPLHNSFHSATASRMIPGASYVEARGGEFGMYCLLDPELRAEDQSANPVVVATRVVGRNKLCPCGSGQRYKHCHGRNRG